MASIAIELVSDDIMHRLQRLAENHEQDVSREARECLERGLCEREEVAQTLERLRKLRESMPNAWLTEEFLREAKNEGRL